MATIHETAYPRFKPVFTQKELVEVFKPNSNELLLLDTNTKKTSEVSRLGFMLLLKYYQYLGRPVKAKHINDFIKKYVAEQLNISTEIDLKKYSRTTRKRHLQIIREHLNINSDKRAQRQVMKTAALQAATTKENLADIINCIIEALFLERYELPAYKSLVRLSRAARAVTNRHYYNTIADALSNEQKQLIDSILGIGVDPAIKEDDKNLSWFMLKQESKGPTPNNVKDFIHYVNQLKSLHEKVDIDLSFIMPARLEHLRDEAMVTDRSDMQKLEPLKRYALVIILIYMKSASAIDELVQIFILWMRRIETRAKNRLEEYRLKQAEKTDEHILLLYNMLLAVKNNTTDQKTIEAIKLQLGNNIDSLIEQCKEHLGLTEDKHINWMKKPYKNKRYIILNLLDNLKVCSSTQDKSIEVALAFIAHHRYSSQEWLEIKDTDPVPIDLSILSEPWFKVVTGLRKKGEPVTKIHRHYYEIAVLHALMGDLNCSDAYVKDAFIYDDPNKQFISWEEFSLNIDNYCDITQKPKDPHAFVAFMQEQLRATAIMVDKNYHNNTHLTIHKGEPVVKKLQPKEEHPNSGKVRDMMMEEMPVISIVDAMIEVEHWLSLSSYFKPLSGNESKIKDYPERFISTSLSYGCNLGPTQTERSLLKFTRKQIAWLFNHHATEQRINKAITKIINHYNKFELPKSWGTGNSASVDGTFWDMYKQNLLAAHHVRYGRYGGVGYYHVSDQYIALFSNFISSAVHESVYLLDGIVENDSDIKPKQIHGDSWAQSEVLFGLSPLLGIAVMPRIKNFKHLYFYKASKDDFYENINDLFTERPIDWELILTHYHDMLRVIISIQKGKVKASTILRKLCSKSRKNKLYYAFRELGRVERTIFLLKYINDPELRRIIQAATCKSEEFNEFIDWICFGDGGIIGENMQFSQRKIIKFNHLVANMLIFHTVVYQTKIINKLRSMGIDIPDEILTGFAPYWREHLNRFGFFTLNMDKMQAIIEYSFAT